MRYIIIVDDQYYAGLHRHGDVVYPVFRAEVDDTGVKVYSNRKQAEMVAEKFKPCGVYGCDHEYTSVEVRELEDNDL